ncbi:hypothetical protein AAFF_G00336970 [Aldrovandia affinis]|uniref:Uncharacterized protein n=1 Tax=Aldrovandia affinis TaxID=143900 RepID=A0AAD7WPP1_9TELE|nr:hypothetical protein AAFF_G00336970 [Aldrovandia affinis]
MDRQTRQKEQPGETRVNDMQGEALGHCVCRARSPAPLPVRSRKARARIITARRRRRQSRDTKGEAAPLGVKPGTSECRAGTMLPEPPPNPFQIPTRAP